MRIYEIDWLSVVAVLPTYERLTRQERALFIGSFGNEPTLHPAACARLANLGLCEWNGKHLKVTKSARHLHGLLRLATRQDWNDPQAALRYVQQEISNDERRITCERLDAMHLGLPCEDRSARACAELLNSTAITKALAYVASWRWIDLMIGTPSERSDSAWLGKIRASGQGLLREILSGRGEISVLELFETVGDPRCVAWMLAWLTQHLAVVPGLTEKNLTLVVGLVPTANAAPIIATSPLPPQPVTASPPLITSNLRINDVTAMLATIASQPLRINRTGKLGKREHQRLEQCLATLQPQEQLLITSIPRLNTALVLIQHLKLVTWDDDHLVITNAGQMWVGGSQTARQHQLIDYLRKCYREIDVMSVLDPRTRTASIWSYFSMPSFPVAVMLQHIRPLLDKMAMDTYDFASVISWMTHAMIKDRHRSDADLVDFQPAEVSAILAALYFNLLAPVGGVSIGYTAGRVSHLAITSVGRYLLGLEKAWFAPVETVVERPLLIQADHSVVFLAPSPAWEVELARIAARVPGAYGTGTLFRLDKTVTQQATAAKLIAADFLERLDAVVAKPIPANVVRELRGWMDSIRFITVREATLIECADEDTGHLVAAAAKGAKHLGGGVVLLAVDADRAAVLRKLKTLGIYA